MGRTPARRVSSSVYRRLDGRRGRGCLVLTAASVLFVGWLAGYILTAPPLPVTQTVGAVPEGSVILPVGSLGPLLPGGPLVVQAGGHVAVAGVSDVAVARKELHLSEALPFAIAEDAPATVASRSVATVVVRFAARVAIRRAPRRDSRVFAYTRPESEAEALRIEREWLKIQTSTPVEGWVLASEAAIREGEVVAEASFRRAVPVRSAPFPGESLVRWEGRVVRKEAASGASGATRHLLHCQDLRGEKRTLEVPRATWDSFIETDYLIEREGMGVGKYGPPVAFTRIGPPYEVLERQDEWVRIQVQDQGWVARADGELDVRYHYSISRRQALSRWIGRLAGARWLRGRYEAFLLDRRR